jgi:O-antigen/teichoic acid export membrane protein
MIAIEPIYEAAGQVQTLKRLIMSISGLNLALNIYLIPFAGYYGAAAATMISMFTYFLFFGTTFPRALRFKKTPFISAGAGIYLIFVFLRKLNAGIGINVFLIPITGFLLFWLIGFFDIHEESIDPSINDKTDLKGGFWNGEC